MLPVTLCVGVITAFQLSAFTFRNNLAATVILLVLFGYVIGSATMELRFVENKGKSLQLLCTCCWMRGFLSLEMIMILQKIVREQTETWVWKLDMKGWGGGIFLLTQEIIKERTVKVNHLPLEMYCMLPYRKKGIITARSEFQCLALQRIIMRKSSSCILLQFYQFYLIL